jgi:NDP-sugar pyrophosphorylase family protein
MRFQIRGTATLQDITALILAGGLGTRLRSVVADRPKVLVPVHGRPFLAFLLDQLAAAGLRHAVLCTGFRAELVREELGLRWGPLELEYSAEESPLGTGGALRRALPLARSEVVLALNGDSYCDADLPGFFAAHDTSRSAGTLLLTEVADTSRYGRVECNRDGRVLAFSEKQSAGGRGWINAGVYLLNARLACSSPARIICITHSSPTRQRGRAHAGVSARPRWRVGLL